MHMNMEEKHLRKLPFSLENTGRARQFRKGMQRGSRAAGSLQEQGNAISCAPLHQALACNRDWGSCSKMIMLEYHSDPYIGASFYPHARVYLSGIIK